LQVVSRSLAKRATQLVFLVDKIPDMIGIWKVFGAGDECWSRAVSGTSANQSLLTGYHGFTPSGRW
jgi:hypothetical protein